MDQKTQSDLQRLTKMRDAAANALLAAEEALRDGLTSALSKGERGDQAGLAKMTGYSREYLRTLARVYYRSITRYDDDGSPLIKMPAENVSPQLSYQIRDTDKTTVLATVTGQALLDARAEQLAVYRTTHPGGNIAMVSIAHLLPTK